jgi:hypothetical protein
MDKLTYLSVQADSAEGQLQANEAKKKAIIRFAKEMFLNRSQTEVQEMVESIEEAIDNMLFDETKSLEKTVAEYEAADRERHENFERQAI